MKTLNEYQTPETDRQVARTAQVPSPTAPEIVQADFARNLEQRLAMCMEALKSLHSDCTASDFNEHWDSYTNAVEALAATKPKP